MSSRTLICGIAASQHWDTSAESIDIKGMDISSLSQGAVVNWEHKSGEPGSYVGKIIKAKKIYSQEDCASEIELKYWDKCQVPFLFVIAKLFDDFQRSAQEVAGIFSSDEADKSLPASLGFSIEGSKLSKLPSGVIDHSIARKLTLTAQPANKSCIADKLDTTSEKPSADPLAFLFKSQEIELFSEETLKKSESMPMPKVPKPGLKQAPASLGTSIGQTKSGKDVMSHQKVHTYNNFNAEDHRNASVLHNAAAANANTAKNYKLADHYNQKAKMHDQAAAGLERKANRFSSGQKAKENKAVVNKILGKNEELSKALTATGSGMSSPENLTGGAALQKEDLKKEDKLNKPLLNRIPGKDMSPGYKAGMGTSHMGQKVRHGAPAETVFTAKEIAHKQLKNLRKEPKPKLTKSEQWLIRADEAYEVWGKKEEFRSFMKERLPHLTKTEIDSLGKTLLLKKTVEAEKALGKMMGMEKSEISHTPKYGEVKPHLSHKEMMKLPANEHHRLESEHQEHAFAAEDKGDHANATKHKDAAAMHMNYAVAVSKPQKNPYSLPGNGQLGRDREQKKLRTGYAEQYHNKLSKALSST